MATKLEIAEWLILEIRSNGQRRSYQSNMVGEIRKVFGEEWSYRNHNGNWAIDKGVLTEFRKLKDDHTIWDRSDQSWRIVTDEQLGHIKEREARAEESRQRIAEARKLWHS